jgi:hypothetical protein
MPRVTVTITGLSVGTLVESCERAVAVNAQGAARRRSALKRDLSICRLCVVTPAA